jgi:hypothetical protein
MKAATGSMTENEPAAARSSSRSCSWAKIRGLLPDLAPELGQLDPLASAREQLDTKGLLERAHLHRDRRLADAEARRTQGEATLAGYGMEGAQLRKVHNLN